jgi:hypothetical protein
MTVRWPAWLKFGAEQPVQPDKTVWVCYRSPVWVVILRRHMSPQIQLRQAPNLEFLREVCARPIPTFAIYEWQPEDADKFLSWIRSLKDQCFPRPVAVLLNRGTIAQELALRELGVVHVVLGLTKAVELAKMIDRYFESLPRWSWPESRLAPIRLPWPELSSWEDPGETAS